MYFSEKVSTTRLASTNTVLILIMLDVLLGVCKEIYMTLEEGLNPYYVGCTSRSNVSTVIGTISARLNPYYVGCTSRRTLEDVYEYAEKSLNPYYVGCTSRSGFQTN